MSVDWLPSWYQLGLSIVDDALKALLQPLFPTSVTSPVRVINELPDGVLDTGWIGRLLLITRFGGAADIRRDQAAVQLASITNARTDSLLLNGFVRDVLVCIDSPIDIELPDGRLMTITGAMETTGPEEVPGADYDERIVTSTFLLTFDNPLGTPDYSDHLGS